MLIVQLCFSDRHLFRKTVHGHECLKYRALRRRLRFQRLFCLLGIEPRSGTSCLLSSASLRMPLWSGIWRCTACDALLSSANPLHSALKIPAWFALSDSNNFDLPSKGCL